jgi:hypothetical protein
VKSWAHDEPNRGAWRYRNCTYTIESAQMEYQQNNDKKEKDVMTETEHDLKNEKEELSCIPLGYEHSWGSEEYTTYCNRGERNSAVWLKEELQKLKGF